LRPIAPLTFPPPSPISNAAWPGGEWLRVDGALIVPPLGGGDGEGEIGGAI
jgi:hypothetical protein